MFAIESASLMLLDLFEKACVMAVIACFLVRAPFFSKLLVKKLEVQQQILLGFIFTLFSVYGAVNGLLVDGNLVALSHSGQILAGLLAGPVLGSCVGGVVAVLRYLLGGELVHISALTSLFAGVLAGLYYRFKAGSSISVIEGIFFTASFELVARISQLFFTANFDKTLKVQEVILLPMVLGHMMMVGIFMLVVQNLLEERRNRKIQERLESELSMARNIQLSLVPNSFPTFSNGQDIDIYAILQPAKEVGGDIYDFFFIDEDRFCFIIGDVSGKGMPAALFMSATRTLFKAQADREQDTAEILRRVNNELYRGNDSSMFVTVFCGILHMKTGEVIFSNGGHNPPYLYREGALEMLAHKHGPALGILEEIDYGSDKIILQSGDMLVMYTDGVSEAMNGLNEMYGVQRLEQAIVGNENAKGEEILKGIMIEVEQFVSGAEQSDDITMLAVHYRKQ